MERINRIDKLKDTFKTLKILGNDFKDEVYDKMVIEMTEKEIDYLIIDLSQGNDCLVPVSIDGHQFTINLNF